MKQIFDELSEPEKELAKHLGYQGLVATARDEQEGQDYLDRVLNAGGADAVAGYTGLARLVNLNAIVMAQKLELKEEVV